MSDFHPATYLVTTSGGIDVEVTKTQLPFGSALDDLISQVDTHRGVILSSGFEYPGRHSRWDLGFVNPALEFKAFGREFSFNAFNDQGAALLPVIAHALRLVVAESEISIHKFLTNLDLKEKSITGTVGELSITLSEEGRSSRPSIFSVLRILSRLFRSTDSTLEHFGLWGAFGYDLIFQFEEIKTKLNRAGDIPDCHLFLPLDLVTVDRQKEIATRICYSVQTERGPTCKLSGGGDTFPPQTISKIPFQIHSDHAPGEFAKKVSKVLEGTKRGDYFEVVLSQTFSAPISSAPSTFFRKLAQANPSPYLLLINFGDSQLIGSSPEIFLRITGSRIETCPIAGTIKRGAGALEDADKVRELISSGKDDAELTMCTDVDRNDLARVCLPGSVKVIGRRQLEFYSTLIHSVDHIEGTLAPQFDSLDAFQAHMWACTVTGSPKPAAVQEIENLESSPRGFYSAAVGLLAFNGNINTGITIRTAHIRGGTAFVRAGATLLYGSDPEAEEQETRTKAGALLTVFSDLSNSGVHSGNASFNVSRMASASFTPLSRPVKLLLVDYRDSFVHNLASYLRELGAQVETYRPGFSTSLLDKIKPDLVFLSPGPFSPEYFGIPDFVRGLASRNLPVFGVCLGHQGIGQAFGGNLRTLPTPVHGRAAEVSHNGDNLFAGIPSPFEAARYHSLVIEGSSMPKDLEVTAHSPIVELPDDPMGIVMAIRHRNLPIAGVQFHPESIMTLKQQAGHRILRNMIAEFLHC